MHSAMSVKQTLLKCLSDGNFEKTLEALKTIFEQDGDDIRAQDVVLLHSRWNQIRDEEARGIISAENSRLEKNRIAATLAEMIAKVPATATLPPGFSNTDSGKTKPGTRPLQAPPPNAGGKIPLYIGIGALLVVILLIVLYPCPTGVQFFVIRTLTALGVAGLAYFLPGSLDLNLPEGVKAGGSLAVLVLLYLLNPAGGLLGKDCNAQVPVTVFVHGPGGCEDLILDQGQVMMRVEKTGERKEEAIDGKGQAKFSGLRVGERVRLQIKFSEPYRAVRPDSVYTISENGSICLETRLEHLDKVFGKTIFNNRPLAGVVVSIGSALRDTTDDLGDYEIKIPPALQKKEQQVTFYKTGFQLLTKKAFPQTDEPLSVIMER